MVRVGVLVCCSLLFIVFFGASSCKSKVAEYIDTVACPIDATVNSIRITHSYFNKRVQQKTKAYYEANEFKKTWLDPKGPNKRYRAFADEVRESYMYGMNPNDYHISALDSAMKALYKNRKRDEQQASILDMKITASFFLFTTHLLEGRVRKPGAADFIWKRGMPREDDVALLLDLKTASDIRSEFERLQPFDDPMYNKLRKALAHYRLLEMERQPKVMLHKKEKIEPGDSNAIIPTIRHLLHFTDLETNAYPDDSLLYDEHLVNAVKKFQRRHGLNDDGIIGSRETTLMNIPFAHRAEQIALNLERLRWRPQIDNDHEAVIVNVPEYMLRVQKQHKTLLQMRVVLGTEFNATPVFSDTLKYIVFSPTWNVPPRIFEEEFLPNLMHDPAYYSKTGTYRFLKNGIEIDPEAEDWTDENLNPRAFQVIQDPGDKNSLGYVKFVMPNNFNIYLHDTPADRLFNKEDRAFSHGCIRLEKPYEFAELLLEDQREIWNKKRILKAMNSPEPVQVKLRKLYPVHIVYRTAWVDEEGLVNFRDDIYGHDKRHLDQLKQAVISPIAMQEKTTDR
jgi:L,D-transpeptidase YcbB